MPITCRLDVRRPAPPSRRRPPRPCPAGLANPDDGPEAELARRARPPGSRRRSGARSPLERGRQVEQLGRGLDARRRRDRRRPPAGRAVSVPVLSKMTVSTRGRGLEGGPAADEDPGLRAATGADHDRGRRREAHRARAGDDDDADERASSASVSRGSGPERSPRSTNAAAASAEDERDEDLADPVGEALDRCLAALGPADHARRSGPGSSRADARRPEDERPGHVERGPDDLVTRGDLAPGSARR